MLRITRLSHSVEQEVLKVEGWLTGPSVELLAEAGQDSRQRGAQLVVDLGGLQAIDEEGIALLKRWAGEQLQLCRATLFIRQLLEQHQLRCEDLEET